MRRRMLPGTYIESSVLGLGTWGLGGPNNVDGLAFGWSGVREDVALGTIRAALDAGINFFDSSDFYGLGRAEELLGRALSGLRERVAVATKVGIVSRLHPGTDDLERDFSPEHLERSVEASLRRLQRETIDVYQLHGPGLEILERDEVWRALERLRSSGKVRYVGVSLKSSHMHGEALARWLECPFLSAVQLEYSVSRPQRARALDGLKPRPAMIARSVLGHGLLLRDEGPAKFGMDDHRARKWDEKMRGCVRAFSAIARETTGSRSLLELVLRFALDSPAISLVLIGATSPEQITECAAAASANPLPFAERAELQRAALATFG